MNLIRLTVRQKNILLFIRSFLAAQGFPPSIREIGAHFKIAPSSVLGHLRALERKEFIRRLPLKQRCLEVLNKEVKP